MTSWQIVRAFAGTLVLLSLVPGAQAGPFFVSQWWLPLAAFVGANLLQSSPSRWHSLEIVLRKAGVKAGC